MRYAYFVKVKRPHDLQEEVKELYHAIIKLSSGQRFFGQSTVRDFLKALNEVQRKVYFFRSPQSRKQRKQCESNAQRSNRKPNDGQYSLWKLTISVRNPQTAENPKYQITSKTMNAVEESSPKEGLILLIYNKTVDNKDKPIFIEKL